MNLSQSLQKYLLTIFLLKKKNTNVHQIDIAIALGYSKASVSRAIHILVTQKYITIQNKEIQFTKLGEDIVIQLIDKYQFFYNLLINQEFSHYEAQDYALKLMRVADDSFIQKLTKHHQKINIQA